MKIARAPFEQMGIRPTPPYKPVVGRNNGNAGCDGSAGWPMQVVQWTVAMPRGCNVCCIVFGRIGCPGCDVTAMFSTSAWSTCKTLIRRPSSTHYMTRLKLCGA